VDPDWENLSIDSSYVRAHQHSAGGKGGAQNQAIGRSRGGLTTKIHAAVDGLGNPSRILLSAGNHSDVEYGPELIADLPAENILADKGYDSNAFVSQIEGTGHRAVIPPRKNRKEAREYDKHLYKERHLVECFFNKIKQYRRIATRYDKLARNYLSMVFIGAILILLK
jgi:transposase